MGEEANTSKPPETPAEEGQATPEEESNEKAAGAAGDTEAPQESEKAAEEDGGANQPGGEEEEKAADDLGAKQDAPEPKLALRIEIRNTEDEEEPPRKNKKRSRNIKEELMVESNEEEVDPKVLADLEYVKNTAPSSKLEHILLDALKRKDSHIDRLTGEITKLKAFISKRKQTYKRKRKDNGAPTRALSAYNIFVQDRFAKLAKENEAALHSADSGAQLKRVPPANLVASTGNEWKELPAEEKLKYEERAKGDRKRYEEQMAEYQPPDKQANRKRNKTGYNMFFSAHVLRLKQSEMGVPSERGSVARLVGTAWKQLSAEEKQYYEREADKHNGMNPVEKEGDEDEDDEAKRQVPADPYAHMHPGHEMQMHGGIPAPAHPGMHQNPQHDPRHHGYAYPPHMYGQPAHGYYDYGHHGQSRQHHTRTHGYGQYPPQQGNPYNHDQRM